MFCRNCGKEIEDSAAFCPSCGTRTEENAPAYNQSNTGYANQPVQNGAQQSDPGMAALVCGIISIALSWLIALVGLILGIVAISVGAKYKSTSKTAQNGFVLGIIGLVASIVFWIISAVQMFSLFW